MAGIQTSISFDIQGDDLATEATLTTLIFEKQEALNLGNKFCQGQGIERRGEKNEGNLALFQQRLSLPLFHFFSMISVESVRESTILTVWWSKDRLVTGLSLFLRSLCFLPLDAFDEKKDCIGNKKIMNKQMKEYYSHLVVQYFKFFSRNSWTGASVSDTPGSDSWSMDGVRLIVMLVFSLRSSLLLFRIILRILFELQPEYCFGVIER